MAIEYRRTIKFVNTAELQGGAEFIYIVPLPQNGKDKESKLVLFRADVIGKPDTKVDIVSDTRADVQINIVDGGVSGSKSQVALLNPGSKGYFDSLHLAPVNVLDDYLLGTPVGYFLGFVEKSYFVSRAPIMPYKPFLQIQVPETAANALRLRIEIVVRIEAISELESVQALYSGGPIV